MRLCRRERQTAPSLPVRGAWVEMLAYPQTVDFPTSLPVRGAWVEMSPEANDQHWESRRSPCGERGLKYV